jgi:dTDP-4-dehydrorhamnose 3,5-epimerase
MIFSQAKIPGVYTVDIKPQEDNRGYFARTYCAGEFAANGLTPTVAQGNVSFSTRRGTLRGLHFQYPPAAETKYVRCTRGAIYDVVVDLRPESASYLQHAAFHLSAENGRGLYVPERVAHGFMTLEDNTEVSYLMGRSHAPGAEGGLLYDDPDLAVVWPLSVAVISTRDTAWRPLAEMQAELKLRMGVSEAVV